MARAQARPWLRRLAAEAVRRPRIDHLGVVPLPGPPGAWTNARDLPVPPTQTFRDWWKAERGNRSNDKGEQR